MKYRASPNIDITRSPRMVAAAITNKTQYNVPYASFKPCSIADVPLVQR